MTCDTCAFFTPPSPDARYQRNTCSCQKFRMAYGDLELEPDEVQVEGDEGWGFLVGPKFGCIHHLRREESK